MKAQDKQTLQAIKENLWQLTRDLETTGTDARTTALARRIARQLLPNIIDIDRILANN